MKLIVGLGNPGPDYEETKHNVGFWVVDAFGRRCHISLSEKRRGAVIGRGIWTTQSKKIDFVLAKPQTFMNRSGQSTKKLLNLFHLFPSDLIVIYDDLDLECGWIRIRTKGRSGGHRGVASIIEEIGSDQFVRLKIGIGRDPRQDPADYVLTPFSRDDKKRVLEAVEKGIEALPLLLEDRVAEAMNRCHADE